MPRSQLLASNSGCPVHSGSSSFAALYRCRGVVDFCQGLGAVGVSRCWLQTVVVLFTLDPLLFAALWLGVVAFPLTSCQFWRSKMAVAGNVGAPAVMRMLCRARRPPRRGVALALFNQ